MGTAVLIITLLTVAASLASWLFSQWLARRARISGAALAVGGGGTVLLIGAAALVVIGAATSWQRFMPAMDSSWLIAPDAETPRRSDVPAAEPRPVAEVEQHAADTDPAADAAMALDRRQMSSRKREMLAEAESHLEASEHAQAIPAALVAEWPATDCVASMRSDESSRWLLDNGCGRVVAVLLASCQLSETACFTNALVSQGWTYEPDGILMTAGNDKPVPLRLGKDGPLVAPIFTIRDHAGARRQIRYLACEVTAAGALQMLRTADGDEQRLATELRADACYSRVLDWTRNGQREGKSPDALLRRGID